MFRWMRRRSTKLRDAQLEIAWLRSDRARLIEQLFFSE